MTITSVMCLLILCAELISPLPGWGIQEHYDLGGPCQDQPSWNGWKEIRDAEKAGEWDRAVALQKQAVRAGCNIQYRWYGLVNALVKAHRLPEASGILQQMDSRGLEVNPALIEAQFPEVVKFMRSKEFGASPLGLEISRLEKISDERRTKFRHLLNEMPPTEKPPDDYVAKNVCPFECCRYGHWTVLHDTDLVASPGSKRVVGKARKGTSTFALTGEVHLRPEPVIVLMGDELPKDSIAFVLDYGGEGYGHVYTHGKVIQMFLGYAEYCFRPSESCWGETLFTSTERKQQAWWVKVRLANGIVGWSNKTENFGHKDACA